MSDAYGFVARIYQPLSRVVFGLDLTEANESFTALARGKKSLIIGGGDAVPYRDWNGRYCGEYWDTSPAMKELAELNLRKSKVVLHLGKWDGEGRVDVVFLPFVLDTMTDLEIETLIGKLADSLNPGGKVVLSDFFSPTTFSQRILQRLMIAAFRLLADHPRTDLPDYDAFFDAQKWRILEEKTWRKGWIRARVYGRGCDSAH